MGDCLGCGIGDDLICEARAGMEVDEYGEGGGIEDVMGDRTGWKLLAVLARQDPLFHGPGLLSGSPGHISQFRLLMILAPLKPLQIWVKGAIRNQKWPYMASIKNLAIYGKDPKSILWSQDDLNRPFGSISSRIQGTRPLSRHAYQEIWVKEVGSRPLW
ncbi:hypothetical protein O181_014419 [Austropuccinia psidii MF-1]|uniref:Uncharacterized protein n=1 Tax=Austropuccinia psidii MF-1 TaxID=1389203 RepID=A0A9Q3BY34_9BASI|nr:hypothetical protein [Austropuccinia psidii MF-1]